MDEPGRVSGDRHGLGVSGVVVRWLPGVGVLRGYQAGWLQRDVVAGLVLTALLVPQGMAYAQLAGMPPVAGIYATLVPLVVYAFVGPSRILIVGPDSAVSPLVAAALIGVAAAESPRAAAIGSLLAILVGGVCVLGGVARLGFVTELFSRPVRIGYLNGLALIIIVKELPGLMGFGVTAGGLTDEVRALSANISHTEFAAVAVGGLCLFVLLGLRARQSRLPGVPIAVVISMIAVVAFDLAIPVVGRLPQGLPTPSLPQPGSADMTSLSAAAVGIALVAFADTGVLSRIYAHRLNERVDQNHELAALGLANLAAGLFQGFPISSSGSRTAVAETSGARTQVAGLVAALGMAAILVGGSDIIRNLPQAALAAIVISAALALVDIQGMVGLARARLPEFALATACFAGVILVGVLSGIFIAIALSLLDFVRRAWRPHDAVLGRINARKGYHDITRNPQAKQVPGLIIYRFDSPLFFANADYFDQHINKLVADADPPAVRVIISAEPITDIDTTAAEMLAALNDKLAGHGVDLGFAELKGPVRDRLQRYGLLDQFNPDHFYPTLGVAVRRYVEDSGVEWTDWKDGGNEPP